MAVEKLFTLPQGQQLTPEVITNFYLYRQNTTPTQDELLSSDLIRPKLDSIPKGTDNIASILPFDLALANVFVDSEPYMSSGPGRFANGSQFDLVRAFG